jgi:NAD(P)-dependent dehydrogenase (short-subunit alcohol dehydrogenase family)
MTARGWGRVINVSSIYGVVASNPAHYPDTKSDNTSYSVSKHGLIGLTKHLAIRLAGTGVTVNAISPGIFMAQSAKVRADGVRPGAMTVKRLQEAIPEARFGTDTDLDAALLFRATPDSAYVTGQNISVDGGFTIW